MYTVLVVKRVEFVNDRMSRIVLRSRWSYIIVLNTHAPSEEKIGDSKDSIYEELEDVFGHFPKYRMKILLRDFNRKWVERLFTNRQLGMRVYIKLVMIMLLEQ